MIVAFTGHRPGKLPCGYSEDHIFCLSTKDKLRDWLSSNRPERAISGMALGWDQWAAKICVELGIPFDAYIPCIGQECKWIPSSRQEYHRILGLASRQVMVYNGPYNGSCMQDRNIAMVDACDILVALWDGSTGGTGNCIRYAKSKGITIVNLW